jgi:hypothetical protein
MAAAASAAALIRYFYMRHLLGCDEIRRSWNGCRIKQFPPAPLGELSDGSTRPGSLHLEQPRKLLDDRAAELLDVHDRHRALVVAGHVVADADGDELDR